MATTFDSTIAKLGIGSAANAAKSSTAKASDTLGQSDFLKLMTAQLNNQDPFNPVDNTQMVAQMAQFSSVAGISEMNTTLKAIADKLAGTSASDALAYVGHTVLVDGDTAFGRTTGGIAGAVELDGDASDVTVTIESESGEVLKTISLGASGQGTIEYEWDGKNSAGADAGPGPFKISVVAKDGSKPVESRSLVWAPVAAVSMPSNGPAMLSLPGIGQVPITDVRQIG